MFGDYIFYIWIQIFITVTSSELSQSLNATIQAIGQICVDELHKLQFYPGLKSIHHIKSMKAVNKIMLAQFKAKLKKIINTHPSQSVRFSQFMELLTINFIRIYSKTQIAKIYKFFDNPLKICRLTVPLSYLNLECIQESEQKKYFVVKVSGTQIYIDLTNTKEKKHSTSQCLEAFIKIMKRLYGSEKNWFRGLGGLTVAITINTSAFKFSISTIMRNTSHANCTEDIVKVFLKQSSSSDIEWKGFMKVISDYDLTKPYIPEHRMNWTSSSFASVQVSKIIFDDQNKKQKSCPKRKLSLSSNRNRRIQSAYTKEQSPIKNSLRTTNQQQTGNKQLVEFPRFFSVSAKPCVLYDKKQKFNNTLSSSFRPNTSQHSVRKHRKTNTQPNFFQQTKMSSTKQPTVVQTTNKKELSQENLRGSQLRKSQKQIECVGRKVEKLVDKQQNQE